MEKNHFAMDLGLIQKLTMSAILQLRTYGVWDTRTKWKRAVKKYVFHRQVTPEDLVFWPTGLLADGLWSVRAYLCEYKATGREEAEMAASLKDAIEQSVTAYFNRWFKIGAPICFLDNLLAGEVLLSIYEEGGPLPKEQCKTALDKLADFAREYPVDADGSYLYRANQKTGEVFVDCVGLVCPFLYRCGSVFGDKGLQELAMRQITNFLQYGMDAVTGLPYHGYDRSKQYKCGIVGWGRAVGWLLRGMAGCLGEMNDEYRRLIDAVLAYQRDDGSFAWQLTAGEGPKDTSAIAMIAVAVREGIKQGILCGEGYEASLQKAKNSLAEAVCDDGIGDCSGECEGFAQYPQRYGTYPWSLGPALKLWDESGFL